MTSVLFDFNGTISDDEPLLCAIFQELFADAGMPLEEEEYFDRLTQDEELHDHVKNAYASARSIYDELLGGRGPQAVATRVAKDKDIQDELRKAVEESEIVIEWLGRPDPAIVDRKIARYRARASDGSTVDDETRRAVLCAAESGPVAIVSGAARSEIEPVLAAAGLRDAVSLIV